MQTARPSLEGAAAAPKAEQLQLAAVRQRQIQLPRLALGPQGLGNDGSPSTW